MFQSQSPKQSIFRGLRKGEEQDSGPTRKSHQPMEQDILSGMSCLFVRGSTFFVHAGSESAAGGLHTKWDDAQNQPHNHTIRV